MRPPKESDMQSPGQPPGLCSLQRCDTFYVIGGTIRIFAREPEEDVCLTMGQTYSVRPGRPHLVANAGDTSAVFLVLQGMGQHDFFALT
jgi:quercetin dioxygenase-like cupin family protein